MKVEILAIFIIATIVFATVYANLALPKTSVRYSQHTTDLMKQDVLEVFREQNLYVNYFRFVDENTSLRCYVMATSLDYSKIPLGTIFKIQGTLEQQNWTVIYCNYPVQEYVDDIQVWVEITHSLVSEAKR